MKFVLLLTIATCILVQVHCVCDSATGLLTQDKSGGTTISLDATGTTASGPATTPIYNQLTTVSLTLTASAYLSSGTRIFGSNGRKSDGSSITTFASDAYTVLKFTPAVSAVLVKMNYSPDDLATTGAPTLTVQDDKGNPLACYDIEVLAPIRTPNGTNEYAWRGVTSDNKISQLKVSGALLAYWDITFFNAPVASAPIINVDGDTPVAGPRASTSVRLSVGLILGALVAVVLSL